MMPNLRLRTLAKRNIWPLPSGELAVRPGLRKVLSAESGRKIVHAFSVRVFNTDEVFHYVVDVATSGLLDVKIRIYDDDFTAMQVYSTYANDEVKVVTHALVKDQILICSPSFPTVWGTIGGFLVKAVKVASRNEANTTAIEVPRGIVVSWASRAVIFGGNSAYIGDPVAITGGSPRTFVAQNQWPFGAAIYGAHVTAGGRLVVCTTEGVYALESSAAAAGQVPSEDWYTLTEYRTIDFNTTCYVHGRIYGLTERGFRLIDQPGTEEIPLDDPRMSLALAPRIASDDYRQCRILAGSRGPMVAYPDAGAVYMLDMAEQMGSWWTFTHTGETGHVVGTLMMQDGREALVTEKGAYVIGGNFDGGEALSENATLVVGSFYGPVRLEPQVALNVRRVTFGTDTEGQIHGAVCGQLAAAKTPSSSLQIDASPGDGSAPLLGPIIGTNTWDAAAVRYGEARVRSEFLDFNVASDDLSIEIGAEHPLTRFSDDVEVQVDGPAEERPVDR